MVPAAEPAVMEGNSSMKRISLVSHMLDFEMLMGHPGETLKCNCYVEAGVKRLKVSGWGRYKSVFRWKLKPRGWTRLAKDRVSSQVNI